MAKKVYVNIIPEQKVKLVAKIDQNDRADRRSKWACALEDSFMMDGESVPKIDDGTPVFDNTGWVNETNSGGNRVFNNSLKLPAVGGNLYTVTVGKRTGLVSSRAPVQDVRQDGDEAGVERFQLEAWRKLRYALNWMPEYADLKDGLMQAVNGLLKPGFIELVQEGDGSGQVSQEAATSWETLKTCLSGKKHDSLPGKNDTKDILRIVLAKQCLDTKPVSEKKEGTISRTALAGWVRDSDKTYKRTFNLPADSHLVFAAKSTLQSHHVKHNGTNIPTTDYTASAARADDNERAATVAISHNQLGGWLSTDGHTLEFEFTFNCCTYLAGLSEGPTIVIGLDSVLGRFGAGLTAATKQGILARVIAHEIAHAIGLLVQSAGKFRHGKFYAASLGGHGDLGHCSDNAKLVTSATCPDQYKPWGARKDQFYIPDGTKQTCIMLHRVNPGKFATAVFCPDCIKQIRVTDIRAACSKDWQKVQ